MGPRGAMHERRLADDGIHHIKVAAGREGNLHAVVAEGDVAVGVVVPAKLVAAALHFAACDIAGLRLQQYDLRTGFGAGGVESPEVELLAEDHGLAVCAERRLEYMVVFEEGELGVGTCRDVVPPDVSHAAFRVQIVESRAVGHPLRTAAVALMYDHRYELGGCDLVAPDLSCGWAQGVAALAVQFVTAAREKDVCAVRAHYGVGGLNVEEHFLCAALIGVHGEDSEACLGA